LNFIYNKEFIQKIKTSQLHLQKMIWTLSDFDLSLLSHSTMHLPFFLINKCHVNHV
jgi:hypothetical protein